MTTKAKLTLEEFLARPETKPASEFACGEVLQKPMPDLPHYIVSGFLVEILHAFVRPRNLGLVGPELRCVFGPPGRRRTFVPDVVFVSFERLPRGDTRTHRRFEAAPNLAIEVLSPDHRPGRFANKLQFYLMHGVQLVWVVDPVAETVDVFAPDAEPLTLRRGEVLDGRDVLPGFQTPVADLFAQLEI